MEHINLLFDELRMLGVNHPAWALLLTLVVGALFVWQLRYYLMVWGRLPRYRNNPGAHAPTATPPLSVIVVIRENAYYFLDNTLPKLLSQQYEQFEVVVVDCSYDEEIGEALAVLGETEPRLRVTAFHQQAHIEHGTKLALTVGIKAASYDHLILTTPDAYPVSNRWLGLMAKGFQSGEIVLGYCGIEPHKGDANRWIRCSRFALSMRYLTAAMHRAAYRGICHNIGYTKQIYFRNRGFNHLNMELGDDDLFIQKIATSDNVSIILNPHATVRQLQYGGMSWWWALCRTLGHTYRYYPRRARWMQCGEQIGRCCYLASTILLTLLLPVTLIAIPLGLWLLREALVALVVRRSSARLGERHMTGSYILYDLWAPIGGALTSLARHLHPNHTIWR